MIVLVRRHLFSMQVKIKEVFLQLICFVRHKCYYTTLYQLGRYYCAEKEEQFVNRCCCYCLHLGANSSLMCGVYIYSLLQQKQQAETQSNKFPLSHPQMGELSTCRKAPVSHLHTEVLKEVGILCKQGLQKLFTYTVDILRLRSYRHRLLLREVAS